MWVDDYAGGSSFRRLRRLLMVIHHYGSDEWWVTCDSLMPSKRLAAVTLEEAKREAERIVRDTLTRALSELDQ